ncbi:MAG: hypothetical protein GOU98_02805 [Candidatus Altiarchaeota archaeon]|nr:hypothetical protein [Candidatus Altiarchaeota archaeon]
MSTGVEATNDSKDAKNLSVYALITDAHLAFRQVSDSPDRYVKLGIVDGMPYYKSALKNLRDLRQLKQNGKIKKIVLMGDVFDHILSEGPNIIHDYMDLGEPEDLNETSFDISNFKAYYNMYQELAKEIRDGVDDGDMIYVIGNHEDPSKLKDLDINYVDYFEADNMKFVHGDEHDSLLGLAGLAPDSGGIRGKLKSWAYNVMTRRKPEAGIRRFVSSMIKNTTRVYGLVNYFSNEMFQKLGSSSFEKYQASVEADLGRELIDTEKKVLQVYHDDFVTSGFGLHRAKTYLDGHAKENPDKFIVMGHEHTPYIHEQGAAFSNLYSGGVSFIGRAKNGEIRTIHGLEGASGILEDSPHSSYSKLFSRAAISEYRKNRTSKHWKSLGLTNAEASEEHLEYVSNLLEEVYSNSLLEVPDDLSQTAQETSHQLSYSPLIRA